MNKPLGDWKLNVAIANESRECCEVVRKVVDQLEFRDWTSADVFAIQMALEESIMNAIKHGNKRDPHKSIHVEVTVANDLCRIKVRDQGEGFDPCTVPDPTLDENLDKCCGRGIRLIHEFMDSVSYNACGNEVEMVKHRTI